jgi:glycosyltransferase involved in cell wall biosynthesis
MKRIALFSHGGFDRPGEGVHVPFLAGLVRRLGERFDLSVYAPGGTSDATPPNWLNARRVPLPVTTSSPVPLKVAALWRAASLDNRRHAFDLVHGIWAIPSGALAAAFGTIRRIPSVVSLHGAETASLPSISYGNMRGEPYRSVTRWTCRHAGALVALSGHQRDSLRRAGILREDVIVVPPGAEPGLLVAMPRRPPSDGPLHVLHVANLTEVKDQETLLRAFAAISADRDAELRVVGGDYLRGRIQQRASELGIAARVAFTGFVPHEAMAGHYAWAHVLMQTSLHEAGGVAVCEAAAARVVVCGTATGILADLAEECTVAVSPGDHEGLARSVLALLADPERFTNIQEGAYRWARENTAETAARLIGELYERLLAR